jgi:hypothetical protein
MLGGSRLRSERWDHDQWLNSCDEEALTGGANLALVGDELLQFADVEPLGAGRFRLTRLRRGFAGTEWALSDHAIGDLFLLIRPGSMQPIALPIRARGSAVTVSQATSGGRTTTTTDADGGRSPLKFLRRFNSANSRAPKKLKYVKGFCFRPNCIEAFAQQSLGNPPLARQPALS